MTPLNSRRKKTQANSLPDGYVIQSTSPSVDQLKDQYAQLGLSDVDRFVTGTGTNRKFNETKAQEATIREVYKLDPKAYVSNNRLDFNSATKKYQFELPKVADTKATDFMGSISAFQAAVDKVKSLGIENLNETDKATIAKLAKQVRDYDSDSLSANAKQAIKNITDAQSAIDAVYNQMETVRVQNLRRQNLDADGKTRLGLDGDQLQAARNRYQVEQDTLRRLVSTTNQAIPGLSEAFTRIGVTDVVSGLGSTDKRVGEVDTGLSGLGADKVFGKSSLVGKLNSQVTDDQIRADLASTRRKQAESVYKLGNEALVDLQSRLQQANAFKAGLAAGDPRVAATQKEIDRLTKDIADVTADTNAAKSIFDNPGDIDANVISSFRETLRLPEERAIDQIREIDPNLLDTAKGLSGAYKDMVNSPLGPTTDDRTEAMRGMIEDEAMNQLRLGSTLDESVRREVEQAARGAQAARGNIFGVAPAVEEAMQTGMLGEQRKAQRYGAAAAFLGSGQTRGDAAARDLALRQSLNLSRLGAANEFLAGGANPYNLANQRVANQNANFLNYINANTAASGGFANTAPQAKPYQYVDPNAGFQGAQTAASIYNTMQNAQASMYGSQVGAIAQGYRSPFQNFASVAGGVSDLFKGFGSFFPKGF